MDSSIHSKRFHCSMVNRQEEKRRLHVLETCIAMHAIKPNSKKKRKKTSTYNGRWCSLQKHPQNDERFPAVCITSTACSFVIKKWIADGTSFRSFFAHKQNIFHKHSHVLCDNNVYRKAKQQQQLQKKNCLFFTAHTIPQTTIIYTCNGKSFIEYNPLNTYTEQPLQMFCTRRLPTMPNNKSKTNATTMTMTTISRQQEKISHFNVNVFILIQTII